MRVLCVNYGLLTNSIGNVIDAPELKEGNVYTVLDEHENAYELYEVKTPEGHSGFNKNRFIPCSDIDEMELQTKKEHSIANLFKWL